VVGTKLQLEPVGGAALRAGHDAGVGDQHVDAVVAVGDIPVGERPNRLQRGQVGLVEINLGGARLGKGGTRLVDVAHHTDDVCSAC